MFNTIISALKNNKLVCFPTETVYALACNATSTKAINTVYRIKERPKSKPLSVFVQNIYAITKIADLSKKEHIDLINHFSPGPVTYVLPIKKNTELLSTLFKASVGIRIPDHPIATSILNEIKFPIIATSINISGGKSICKISNIPKSIKKYLSVIIDDDNLVSGIESTVLDLTLENKINILRQGAISKEVIENALSHFNITY
ncbi:L-threonylcarbamoyladenylate synthase [Wolbachia endosymbiont of Pentidionis agamae]|uniref:L-threonylcarbamoyladenylate synthase n=1 Tax=Wolbachia endosymbiont of Pentidionis agamae TaxID=3110435 RepID=UPI002FD5DBA0